MTHILSRALLVLLVLSFVATFGFLVARSRETPTSYAYETPVVMDIVQKTITSGSVVPKEEIEVKSRLSGVVGAIFVEPGDVVAAGDPLVSVRVIPASIELNRAEAELERALILLEDASEELERRSPLRERNGISEMEYNELITAYRLALADYEAAENNLTLLRDGVSGSGREANVVAAPAGGTVLELPIRIGSPVVESNSFNEGTTVALLADMSRLVFEGYLEESEIGRVEEGMDMEIHIAAIEGETFHARLDRIAPKGEDVRGSIQFRIEGALDIPPDRIVRAGYSANADIVLARADGVPAVPERDVLFEGTQTFVEVEAEPQRFERREVTLGISDGIMVEIAAGLAADESVKVQQ